jgi:hypothetical protein
VRAWCAVGCRRRVQGKEEGRGGDTFANDMRTDRGGSGVGSISLPLATCSLVPLHLVAAFGDSGAKKDARLSVALHHFTELWKKI